MFGNMSSSENSNSGSSDNSPPSENSNSGSSGNSPHDSLDLSVSSSSSLLPTFDDNSQSTSVSTSEDLSYYDPNILITGSKYSGKSSLCETLLVLLAHDDTSHFEYIDVNHLRTQSDKLNLPLNDKFIKMVATKLNDGFVLIEDTKFDEIYDKTDFAAIFILTAEDAELEQRLISRGDFHTPYNDFHIMEPYNTVCEKFPYTKNNKVFILNNTIERHLDVNAKFIKKWIDENIYPQEKNQVLDSDGESHISDSDDSDANETLILADGKFKKDSFFTFPNDMIPVSSDSYDDVDGSSGSDLSMDSDP